MQPVTAEIGRLLEAGEFQTAIAHHAALPGRKPKEVGAKKDVVPNPIPHPPLLDLRKPFSRIQNCRMERTAREADRDLEDLHRNAGGNPMTVAADGPLF